MGSVPPYTYKVTLDCSHIVSLCMIVYIVVVLSARLFGSFYMHLHKCKFTSGYRSACVFDSVSVAEQSVWRNGKLNHHFYRPRKNAANSSANALRRFPATSRDSNQKHSSLCLLSIKKKRLSSDKFVFVILKMSLCMV